MKILFTSMRHTGHFQPLVPFISACRRAGHEVAVAAPGELGDRVASTGAAFYPFAHPGESVLGPMWAHLRTATPDEARRIVLGDIFAGVVVRTALPDLLAIVERTRPAVIVREAQEFAGLVVAEKHGIPHVRIAITLGHLAREVLEIQAPNIDTHRVALGLPLDPSGERISDAPALTQVPASLEFPGTPGAERLKRYRDPPREASPLCDWWGASQSPLVYVTLGTVTGDMDAHRGVFRIVLEAASNLPVRVLLTTGVEPAAIILGDIPRNVHVERFVAQADVLPHAAAVVCHGGTGTVVGALAAGVPLVVTPMFADQPQNAERVTAIGAGIGLVQGAITTESVRAALSRVLEEPMFRAEARRVADEVAALPPMEDAVTEIERVARGS